VPALLSLVFQVQDRLGLLDRGEDRIGDGAGAG
jgi:hypothetical protein